MDGTTYLRTGDYGTIYQRELFITGRIKETLVIRGQNFYPTDLEQAVRDANDSLSRHSCVVFSVPRHNEDQIVVVAEISRRDHENTSSTELTGDVQETMARRFGLHVHRTLFVRPGSIPKTSSGKLRRGSCREMFRNGELERLQHVLLQPE